MTTFALDTATPDPALAIVDGDDVVAESWLGRIPGGGRRVLEAAHDLFTSAGVAPADLDDIVVGIGPGGFTGIRIGIATALGLGQALGIPVQGASTLEALALGIALVTEPAGPPAEGMLVVPVIDARRGQVFGAAYRVDPSGGLQRVIAPAAWDPADLATAVAGIGPCAVAGDGAGLVLLPADAHRVADEVADRISPMCLVRRVRAGAARPVAPEYLRLPDAEENRLRRLREEAPA
ncbi:MAG: tRNA (adenosine(37)-N6)-threonylcarbamoyltransferase complex dimerization subunit type 1 TsaB [Acidobacteria bacterium]|nr:tRNA (adenosine(37)-N6)-threonylcarbamoyltransferase complex dimerization subunit type 1 TsaB [Acidobacteriota bacterium]